MENLEQYLSKYTRFEKVANHKFEYDNFMIFISEQFNRIELKKFGLNAKYFENEEDIISFLNSISIRKSNNKPYTNYFDKLEDCIYNSDLINNDFVYFEIPKFNFYYKIVENFKDIDTNGDLQDFSNIKGELKESFYNGVLKIEFKTNWKTSSIYVHYDVLKKYIKDKVIPSSNRSTHTSDYMPSTPTKWVNEYDEDTGKLIGGSFKEY